MSSLQQTKSLFIFYFKLKVKPKVWIIPNWPAKRIAYSNPKPDLFLPTNASAEKPAVNPVNALDLFSVDNKYFSYTYPPRKLNAAFSVST